MMRHLLLSLLFTSAHLWGCVCGSWPSAKTAWQQSPLVFAGHVERTDPNGDIKGLIGLNQTVLLRVDEAFKGVVRDQTLTVNQGNSDCDAKFKTGEHVLLYLNRGKEPDTWIVPACGRSRQLESAADDFLFLRRLPVSAKGNRLSGEVELYENSGPNGFQRTGTLPGIKVNVFPKNGAPFNAVTNAEGVYELYNLPPGKYKIAIEIPKGLRIDFPMITGVNSFHMDASAVDLGPDSGVSVSFVLMGDTKMIGRVLDPNGRPLNGVCIEPEPFSGEPEGNSRVFNCSKADGKYVLEMMPPGQYRIVANRGGKLTSRQPFPTVYYPGTTDPEKALPVTVTMGAPLEGLDIRIPALAKVVQLSGRVQFLDGVSARAADLIFVSNTKTYQERSTLAADGSFRMPIVAGNTGEIHAQIMVWREEAAKCPQFGATFRPTGFGTSLETPPGVISGESDESGITLVLPVKSCADWPAQ